MCYASTLGGEQQCCYRRVTQKGPVFRTALLGKHSIRASRCYVSIGESSACSDETAYIPEAACQPMATDKHGYREGRETISLFHVQSSSNSQTEAIVTGVIYRSTSNVVLMSIRVQTLTDHARNLVARIRGRRLTCGGASRETQNPEDIAPSLNSLHGVQASVAIEATSAVSDETDCIPNSRVRLAVVQGPANPTSATQQTTRRA
ncbi:hypothetical protein BC629DRAFT_1725087 [Irpex lacteus]|nr:hypothetical protein BC629DRAFT_1725087 [Irpex lacteus]